MGFIEGESRGQTVLFPEVLDDYITAENVVRFIDAFVDGLEMEAMGFDRTAPRETGRPPYDPRDLLKLYIYVLIRHRKRLVAEIAFGLAANLLAVGCTRSRF